jgi:hypothetical protein
VSDTGLIGELFVELRLAERGWHPVRLDRRRAALNVDLVAVRGTSRVAIQVKATSALDHSHRDHLQFGYSNDFLAGGTVFNGKESPLKADVVVGVSHSPDDPRIVILPVAFAEALCGFHCRYWSSAPAKKRDTGEIGQRSKSFPLYLAFRSTPTRGKHVAHAERLQRNLLAFEDKWEILEQSIERLHDPRAWPLID